MLVFKHQIQVRTAVMVGVFSDWLNRGAGLERDIGASVTVGDQVL